MKFEANATTGEVTVREMTEQEIIEDLANQSKCLINEEKEAAKAAQKAELLAKLGISEDEAKLLIS